MKKNGRLALLALALVLAAGFAVIGCPSDPDEGNKIEDGEDVMTFAGGKYQYEFDNVKIEEGKEYEVILSITDCDTSFVGSYLGGKIIYKIGEAESVLSGWLNSAPLEVAQGPKEYQWVFKAGDKNSDSQNIASPATTPDGATQYFSLTAQNAEWSEYPAGTDFNVKGKFEVKSRESISEWVQVLELTLGNEDSTAGKGAISDAQMTTIRSTVEAEPRSIIRFTVHVPNVGAGGASIGYGVCGVGDWSTGISIAVPSDAVNGQSITFTKDLEVSAILATLQPGYQIAINPYNTATVTKAVLMKPGK